MSKSSTIVHLRLPQFLVDVYKVMAKEHHITLNAEMEQALFGRWETLAQQPEEKTEEEIQQRREDKILYYIQHLQAPTLRDLGRYIPKFPKDTLKTDLARLVEQGKLQARFTGRSYRYSLPSHIPNNP